jgi:hypothetical protein
MMPGFRRMLPLLVLYWVLASASAVLGQSAAFVIASWATVTTIMLWPVGGALGRGYGTYRTPWFVVGVGSMVGIPLFGYLIVSSPISDVKLAALFGLAVDIGVWGILASTRGAFSSPIRMLFRPDLIFGDGRLLAGGVVAIGLGMKFIFSDMPPGNVPVGNWYALLFVILLGLIQMIPLRGMWKMRNRMSRVAFDRWGGYWTTVAKESYLLLAVAALMFGFHNFFGGVTPLTRNVLMGSTEGLAIMGGSAFFVVLVRAWYKKNVIGDPFLVESYGQSLLKHSILVVGLVGFVYGFLHLMLGGFPRLPNAGDDLYLSVLGILILAWGIALLVPIRVWAQGNQRRAIMGQMVQVLLPSLDDESLGRAVGKVVRAVSQLSQDRRLDMVKEMYGHLHSMSSADKERVMRALLAGVSSLSPVDRIEMMSAMDGAIGAVSGA